MHRISPAILVALVVWVGGVGGGGNALAADAGVTFYEDVLTIVQENCQVCHRAQGANLGGMVAPMSFETYEETRPWAKAMAKAVQSRAMPPWHGASQQKGRFRNERSLTQEEIDTLVAWARTGARRGDPEQAPPPKEWPGFEGWTIGKPDLVLQPDEPFLVKDEVEDQYVYLKTTLTPELLPEDRYIKAVEFRPGSSAVHHIITYPLGGIAPGNEPTFYPEGIGALLKKGTDITWEMHYHKEPGPGTAVWDRSTVAIRFYDDPGQVKHRLQGNDLGRYDFTIPAGDPAYEVRREYTFQHDSKIVSMMPHFHLRGKSAKYEAQYPDGSREVLLEVPRYDFNWQTTYSYKEFKEVPKGTKIVFTTVWDNSAENPYNPDPTVDVFYGEPTTDEMSYGYVSFINDSGDHEAFFDNLSGANGSPVDLVALVYAFDDDHDRKLQRAEAPEEMRPFFGFVDRDRDGAIDLAEASAAMEASTGASGPPSP